jgi:hypothetical protein
MRTSPTTSAEGWTHVPAPIWGTLPSKLSTVMIRTAYYNTLSASAPCARGDSAAIGATL